MSETAPYQPHSDTSKAAAEAAARKMGPAHKKISAYLQRLVQTDCGATDEEMATDLGMGLNTLRPRRVELVRMGLCKDSGRRRVTRSEQGAVVWIACKEPAQPDGSMLRASKIRKALAPFIPRLRAELDSIIEAGAPEGALFTVSTRTTEAQLRALIEAWEG